MGGIIFWCTGQRHQGRLNFCMHEKGEGEINWCMEKGGGGYMKLKYTFNAGQGPRVQLVRKYTYNRFRAKQMAVYQRFS